MVFLFFPPESDGGGGSWRRGGRRRERRAMDRGGRERLGRKEGVNEGGGGNERGLQVPCHHMERREVGGRRGAGSMERGREREMGGINREANAYWGEEGGKKIKSEEGGRDKK